MNIFLKKKNKIKYSAINIVYICDAFRLSTLTFPFVNYTKHVYLVVEDQQVQNGSVNCCHGDEMCIDASKQNY